MGRTHLDLHRGELDPPVFDKTTEITAVQADRAGRLTTVLVDGTVETVGAVRAIRNPTGARSRSTRRGKRCSTPMATA